MDSPRDIAPHEHTQYQGSKPSVWPGLWHSCPCGIEARQTECMGWRRPCMPEKPVRDAGNRLHWPPEPDTCVNCRALRGAQLSSWRRHLHAADKGRGTPLMHAHTHRVRRRWTDPERSRGILRGEEKY